MTKSITLNYTIAAFVAIAMVLAFAGIADAAVNSTKINIQTYNSGTINNTTQADAHSGANSAAGSTGGNGGYGGAVLGGGGSENNGGASAGNGGNGGNGGEGGLVETGDATANAGTENSLNGTDVEVAFDCDCGDINSVTLDIVTDNDNSPGSVINNTTRADGRSGANSAAGSTGGNGGYGGVIDGSTGSENNGGASAGMGGSGGAGDFGGTIRTGNASSTSGSLNLLNTTIVRVRL